MKHAILTLAVSALGLTAQAAPTVDCSKATQGSVSIATSGELINAEKAASLAFACLLGTNKKLTAAHDAAVKKAKASQGEPDKCGEPGDLRSWGHGDVGPKRTEDAQVIVHSVHAGRLRRDPHVEDRIGDRYRKKQQGPLQVRARAKDGITDGETRVGDV